MNIARRYTYTVDLNAPLVMTKLPGMLHENDADADVFVLKVVQGKEAANLTGCTANGYFVRADGNAVQLNGSVTQDAAEIPLKDECYHVPGDFAMFVRLKDAAGAEVTVFKAAGRMDDDGVDSIVDNDRIVPTLDELLEKLNDLETATNAANAAAAAANTATQKANAAAGTANSSAQSANNAADGANTAAQQASKWANATASARQLPAGSAPTAAVTDVNGVKNLAFGIPKGDQGLPFMIKGEAYATLAALQAAVTNPAEGDQYNVGTAAPYNVYRWTGSAWEDQGKLGSAAIDDTLTHSGQAADAKAVGDALAGKLNTAGGTMTGNLEMSGGTEYRAIRVTRTVGGEAWQGELGLDANGSIWIRLLKDGVVMNSIKLNEAAMVLGTPLPAESGGTGVSSMATLRQRLGVDAETFTDSVTYNVAKNFASFRRVGNTVHVNYQSTSAEIAQGTVLFTLPEGYRPADRYTSAPFVVDGTAFGRILIDNTTGEAKVLRISQTATGVAVVNMHYAMNAYYIVG